MSGHKGFWHRVEISGLLTLIGIIVLFSGAVIVTLIAPSFIDKSWIEPTSHYQVQMYEISDPNFYISATPQDPEIAEAVYHLRRHHTLLSFQESETVRILAPNDLEKYVTRFDDPKLKLTSELLLLRHPRGEEALKKAENFREILKKEWLEKHPNNIAPTFSILELYAHQANEAFAIAPLDQTVHDWVDLGQYVVLDSPLKQAYHSNPGVIYVNNPIEYRVIRYMAYGKEAWRYDSTGEPIANLEMLQGSNMGFLSRKELIHRGELIYAAEGCWYCHTDQTRTLVQDVVLNGSAEYPAPPSSANEYIYNSITFPGTHRIGPDLSRTGIKRPGRDWHKAHFRSPKTASKGSIMPAFIHFFDDDPRGTATHPHGVANVKFEAVFQYLMTKGTRITSPTQAWWLGKDPINTKAIIEARRGDGR